MRVHRMRAAVCGLSFTSRRKGAVLKSGAKEQGLAFLMRHNALAVGTGSCA